MRPWSSIILATIINVTILGLPNSSEAQLVLYDNFASGLIDPDKWFASDANSGVASPTAETARLVMGGRLNMLLRQYGRQDSDTGSTAGSITLSVADPNPITTFQAAVAMRHVQVDSCSSNGSGALVRTRLQVAGTFFNDGTSTGSSDRTGDIAAGIQMVAAADSTVGNVFETFVYRCLNSSCSSQNVFLGQPLVTTWRRTQTFTLTVTWDPSNDQFVFSAGRGKVIETVTLPYSQSDTDAAVGPARRIVLFNSAANCNGSRKQAFLEATIDNVMVNP